MIVDVLVIVFMVMGLDEVEVFIKLYFNIGVYFIYSDEKGEVKSYFIKNMK